MKLGAEKLNNRTLTESEVLAGLIFVKIKDKGNDEGHFKMVVLKWSFYIQNDNLVTTLSKTGYFHFSQIYENVARFSVERFYR